MELEDICRPHLKSARVVPGTEAYVYRPDQISRQRATSRLSCIETESGSGTGGRIQVQGSSANVTHTVNEDERVAFTTHIMLCLPETPTLVKCSLSRLTLSKMFDQCKDGLILAKLINDSVPDTIDERVMNKPGRKIKTLNAFHMTENNNIVIQSAKGIGCSVVNIGSEISSKFGNT